MQWELYQPKADPGSSGSPLAALAHMHTHKTYISVHERVNMCCVGVSGSEKQLKMPDSGKMIEIHHCIISVTRCLGEVARTHPRTCTHTHERSLAPSYKECTCKCVHKEAQNFEIKTRWIGRWEPTVAVPAGASRGHCLSAQVPTQPRFTLISAKQQQKCF